MGVGKARGKETMRRIGHTHVCQPWQESKFIDMSIDFHSQEHRPGHLALDESSASDLYMRKELGLDPGCTLEDLTLISPLSQCLEEL